MGYVTAETGVQSHSRRELQITKALVHMHRCWWVDKFRMSRRCCFYVATHIIRNGDVRTKSLKRPANKGYMHRISAGQGNMMVNIIATRGCEISEVRGRKI